jgi:hypothetical protein
MFVPWKESATAALDIVKRHGKSRLFFIAGPGGKPGTHIALYPDYLTIDYLIIDRGGQRHTVTVLATVK